MEQICMEREQSYLNRKRLDAKSRSIIACTLSFPGNTSQSEGKLTPWYGIKGLYMARKSVTEWARKGLI